MLGWVTIENREQRYTCTFEKSLFYYYYLTLYECVYLILNISSKHQAAHNATGSRISGQWIPGQKSHPVQTWPFGWWTRLSGFQPPGIKYFSWVDSTEDCLTAPREIPSTVEMATRARNLNMFNLLLKLICIYATTFSIHRGFGVLGFWGFGEWFFGIR